MDRGEEEVGGGGEEEVGAPPVGDLPVENVLPAKAKYGQRKEREMIIRNKKKEKKEKKMAAGLTI